MSKTLLADPGCPLPVLARLVEAPVLGPDGAISVEFGYSEATQAFYAPTVGLDVPPVAEYPSDEDEAEAKRLILDELIGDFPFAGDAERAHTVAALLLPFVRDLITGPTPLHLVEKPAAGTGASLLVSALGIPALGRPPDTQVQPRQEDEWRKLITTQLNSASAYFVLDNVVNLDSSSLASALTTDTWQDRKLATNDKITAPVRCTWIATGNNPSLSREMARRIVRIRLDSHVPNPEDRPPAMFRHPRLLEWSKANRGRLIWACLVLCRRWYQAGKPAGLENLASYESWAATMGGILDVAGVPGFLTNRHEVLEAVADEEADIEFLNIWWQQRGDSLARTSDMTAAALSCGVYLGQGDAGRGLGKWCGRNKDRVFQLPEGGPMVTLKKGKFGGTWCLRQELGLPTATPTSTDEVGDSSVSAADGGQPLIYPDDDDSV